MFKLAENRTFRFMAWSKIASVISVILVLVSLTSIFTRGLSFGIDFTGGTLIEVGFGDAVDLDKVRSTLASNDFGGAIVQHFGSAKDVLIRMAPREGVKAAELSSSVLAALQAQDSSVEMRRVEFVGPQVGDELTEDGGLAVLFALIAILFYIWVRFEWRFSIGSIVALVHDVSITVGIFSIFQIEFDLPVLAAVLAVIGYSLNDTIVVFDRIRENFRKMRKGTPEEVIDNSLNQTLSRTLTTSLTTLLVLLALFILGGEIIHNFALALIIGVIVGTYSSIYVASSTVLSLGVSKEDLMVPVKEGAGQESLEP
jgi:preprotein translocase subunit SecF